MVKPISRKTSSKNPPILSQEFIIQNHADIVSCIAMFLVVGLMFQATSPISTLFVTIQHNVTEPEQGEAMYYMPGFMDTFTVVFYTLIGIVIHAIIQEYILDKISKRLHLSKSKLSIFSQSGQLATYFFLMTILTGDLLIREGYLTHPTILWSDYPAPLSLQHKMLIMVQLGYSLHELPELYFQRIPKSQWLEKGIQSAVAFAYVLLVYSLNFNRLLTALLELYYLSEFVFNVSQIVQTVDKEEKLSKIATLVSNTFLVICRLSSVVISFLTLWFGLALDTTTPADLPGNYNTTFVRLSLLVVTVALQVYLMFNFLTQHLAKARENNALVSKTATVQVKANKLKKDKKKVKKSNESDLPEVDQATNKNLRNQKQKVK